MNMTGLRICSRGSSLRTEARNAGTRRSADRTEVDWPVRVIVLEPPGRVRD